MRLINIIRLDVPGIEFLLRLVVVMLKKSRKPRESQCFGDLSSLLFINPTCLSYCETPDGFASLFEFCLLDNDLAGLLLWRGDCWPSHFYQRL